jgi:Uma2 family endonuclease
MSAPERLDWEPGDGLAYELVDSEPRAMARASTIRDLVRNELGRPIWNYLRGRRYNCGALANPGVIDHLLSAHDVRVPDLGVTCSPLTREQATLPDPVLLIEILSTTNQTKTWSNAWAYTGIPSVLAIVLHSTRMRAA